MKRRHFLESTGAVTGGVFAGPHRANANGQSSGRGNSGGVPQPNILFIVADELRFPTVFSDGVGDAGQFPQKFMPNLYTDIIPNELQKLLPHLLLPSQEVSNVIHLAFRPNRELAHRFIAGPDTLKSVLG